MVSVDDDGARHGVEAGPAASAEVSEKFEQEVKVRMLAAAAAGAGGDGRKGVFFPAHHAPAADKKPGMSEEAAAVTIQVRQHRLSFF